MAELSDSITDILLSGSTAQKLEPTDIAGAMLRAQAGRSSYGEELNRIRAHKINESQNLMKTMTWLVERKQRDAKEHREGWEKAAETFRNSIKDAGLADHPRLAELGAAMETAYPYGPGAAPPSSMGVSRFVSETAKRLNITPKSKAQEAADKKRAELEVKADFAGQEKTDIEIYTERAENLERQAALAAASGNTDLAKRHSAIAQLLRSKVTPEKEREIQEMMGNNPNLSREQAASIAYGNVRTVPDALGGVNVVDLPKEMTAQKTDTPRLPKKVIEETAGSSARIDNMLAQFPKMEQTVDKAVGVVSRLKDWWAKSAGNLPDNWFGLPTGDAALDKEVAEARSQFKLLREDLIEAVKQEGRLSNWQRQRIEALMPDPDTFLESPINAKANMATIRQYLETARQQNQNLLQGKPAPSGGVPRISTDVERDALPSGTVYIGPDGKRRKKP